MHVPSRAVLGGPMMLAEARVYTGPLPGVCELGDRVADVVCAMVSNGTGRSGESNGSLAGALLL